MEERNVEKEIQFALGKIYSLKQFYPRAKMNLPDPIIPIFLYERPLLT